jgi:hypothetical protein
VRTWDEALTAVEEALKTPVEDGFPISGNFFDIPSPLTEDQYERAVHVSELIADRIVLTEAASGSAVADLDWTRNRIQDLIPASGVPVYLDITT